jgi:dienelactone hydrolase
MLGDVMSRIGINLAQKVLTEDGKNGKELLSFDPLDDFQKRDITLNEELKRVYMSGSGPSVIVMTEMPGISPHVVRFARWVRDAGHTVYIPSLFGTDETIPSADEGAAVFKSACVSAQFKAMAANASSPITRWLMALARLAHQESGGPGVGAIGMCFTGNFALTMMMEPSMLAPVLCQPALPLTDPAGLEISPDDLEAVKERLEKDNLSVLAYRFEGDKICRSQRFAAYSAALGDRFIGKVLPDSAANTQEIPPFFATHVNYPHSVVTVHLIDEAGQPTIGARDEILEFFRQRLLS